MGWGSSESSRAVRKCSHWFAKQIHSGWHFPKEPDVLVSLAVL